MKSFDMVFWKEIEETEAFMEENVELMKDLAELEAFEAGATRCICCLNYICTSKEGHADRISR